MYNAIIWRTVQQQLLASSNVSSQFAHQYSHVDTCGSFNNSIISVITLFLFAFHLRQYSGADMLLR